MRVTYECTKGHVIEVYKGLNDPKPKKCNAIVARAKAEYIHETEPSKICGARLEWVPEPVAFTIK